MRAKQIPMVKQILMVSVLITAAACSPAKWHEVAPNTGDANIETQVVKLPTGAQPPTFNSGQQVTIVPERLRGRVTPDQPGNQAPIVLDRGDTVRVVDPTPQGKDGLIEVKPAEAPGRPTGSVYVPPQYVSTEKQVSAADRYIVIQNIATERLRIYERCDTQAQPDCAHKLILETEMTAGEPTPEKTRMTRLGVYRITEWIKFYQDFDNLFPSWYRDGYPQVPDQTKSNPAAWAAHDLLPGGQGSTRGLFGWYTAKVGPDAGAQWTHGAPGWGSDGAKFIEMTRPDLGRYFGDARGQGCTRVENQAIAFMREILPVGTKIIKVYAKEAYRDGERKIYQATPNTRWSWVLTKEGTMTSGPSSDRAATLARHVAPTQVMESGDYIVDQMPDAVPFRNVANGLKNENGNLYALPEASMSGYLVVDEGRLVGYSHPTELLLGGFNDHVLPSLVISNDKNVVLPQGSRPARAQVASSR